MSWNDYQLAGLAKTVEKIVKNIKGDFSGSNLSIFASSIDQVNIATVGLQYECSP